MAASDRDPGASAPHPARVDLFASRPVPPPAPPAPRRRGSFLRLVLLAGVATVLGVGAWVVLGGVASPERLRAEIEESVQHATGRAFVISGPVHVHLGFAPSITAETVSLANIDGGSRPEMLTAKSLSARVALLPLLGGDIVVEEVTLVGPDLLLEQTADGTPNWQFNRLNRHLTPSGFSSQEPNETPHPAHGGAATIEIQRVRLQDGHIAWHSQGGSLLGSGLDLNIASAELAANSNDAPIHGTFKGSTGPLDFTATLDTGAFGRLQGGPVTALAGAWPVALHMQAGDATLKVEGGINHPNEMRGYEFLVTGNAPNLAPFAPFLPRPLALPLHDVNLTVRLADSPNGDMRSSGLSIHAGAADLGSAVPGLVLKDAVFSAPGPGQQAQLNVDGLFQGAPLRLAGTATQPDVLAANVPVPLAFSGEVATATVSARGTVPAKFGANGLDMIVSVHAPSLADLSPLAGRPLPDVHDLVFDAHLEDAGFRLRGVNLRDLTFTSSLGDLSGNLTAAWAPVPTLSGTLNAHKFDLDATAAAWDSWQSTSPANAPEGPPTGPAAVPPPAPTTPPTTDDTAQPRLFSDTPLPFASLHGANADLTLSAGSLTAGHETYRDMQAKLFANDGKLILNPLRITAPGGVVIGAFSLDAGIDPVPVAITLRSPATSAARLSSLLGYPGAATGTVQVDAQLNGTGDTPHALAASLGGHLGMTMVNGTVTDALLQGALGTALNQAGVPSMGGSADVRCFALRADFTHGQGRIQTLSLDTSQLSMDGDGTVDLGNETMALHLRPIVRIGGTGVAAPVTLRGGFFNLKPGLDPTMGGGRFGLTIGGPGPSDDSCVSQLSLARGGMPGPMPSMAPPPGQKKKKPIDLLRGLFH